MEIFIDPSYTPPKLQTQSKGSNSIVLGTKTDLDNITLKRGDQIDIKVTIIGIADITAIKFGSRRSDKLADNLLILAESSTPIVADGNTSFLLTATIHTESLTDAFGLDTAKPTAQLSCLSEFVWVDNSGTMRVSESLTTAIVIDVIREDYPVYEDTASGDLINTTIASHTENTDIHVSEADRESWNDKITPTELSTALTPYASTANLATHTNDTTSHITAEERTSWDKIESVAQTALGECALQELSSTITIPYKGCIHITGAIDDDQSITIKGGIPPMLDSSSTDMFLWEGYLVFYYASGSITLTNTTCTGIDSLESGYSYLLHIRVPAPAVAADIDMPYIKYVATIVAKGSGLDWEAIDANCLNDHINDTISHITAEERTSWDNKLSSVPYASTSSYGIVKMVDTIDNYTLTYSGTAATPKAVGLVNVKIGDLDSLITDTNTDIVSAINEIKADITGDALSTNLLDGTFYEWFRPNASTYAELYLGESLYGFPDAYYDIQFSVDADATGEEILASMYHGGGFTFKRVGMSLVISYTSGSIPNPSQDNPCTLLSEATADTKYRFSYINRNGYAKAFLTQSAYDSGSPLYLSNGIIKNGYELPADDIYGASILRLFEGSSATRCIKVYRAVVETFGHQLDYRPFKLESNGYIGMQSIALTYLGDYTNFARYGSSSNPTCYELGAETTV